MSNDPLKADPRLARALDDFAVPPLSADFATKVLASLEDRPPPLPVSRPSNPVRRWRLGRRLAIGALAAGALASAAAATGILGDWPSPREMWTSLIGERSETAAPVTNPDDTSSIAPTGNQAPVIIEGPIDTPAELEETFRQVDEARGERLNRRRDMIDRRLDSAIERRRENGLPAPTPEQAERLRARIDARRTRRDERAQQWLDQRRDALRGEVEDGASLTPEEVIERQRPFPPGSGPADRIERWRELTPEERRERLRDLRDRRRDRLRRLQDGEQTPPADPSDAPPADQEPPPAQPPIR